MAISVLVSCFVMNDLARGVSETRAVFLLPVGVVWAGLGSGAILLVPLT